MAHIFLSGTFDDLHHEREALLDVFQRIGIAPIAQEFFGASPKSAIETIKEAISYDECYLFLQVIGFRYGSLVPEAKLPQELNYPPNTVISFSEMEFDLAGLAGMPRLIYRKFSGRRPNYDVDEQQAERLEKFLTKITHSGCTYCQFRNRQQMAVQAAIDIMKQLNDADFRRFGMGRDYPH